MHTLCPILIFALKSTGRQPIQCFQFRRPQDVIGWNLPLEGANVANDLRQFQALLTPPGAFSCLDKLGYIHSMHQNTIDLTRNIERRLIDKIEEAFFQRSGIGTINMYAHFANQKRCTSSIDLI